MARDKPIRIVSWNIGKRAEAWGELVGMGVDLGLIQESGVIPDSICRQVATGRQPLSPNIAVVEGLLLMGRV